MSIDNRIAQEILNLDFLTDPVSDFMGEGFSRIEVSGSSVVQAPETLPVPSIPLDAPARASTFGETVDPGTSAPDTDFGAFELPGSEQPATLPSQSGYLNDPASPLSTGFETEPLAPGDFSLTDSFTGIKLFDTGANSIPPDPHGAVGLNHVVNVTNTAIQWFTRDGTLQNSQTLQSFLGSATSTFDPKVMYDPYNDRFVVISLEQLGRGDADAANDVSRIYVAVSDDGNPNGTWHQMTIDSKTDIGGVNHWADYPGLAVDDEAIYITNNMFSFPSDSFGGNRLWVIPKGDGTGGIYDGGAGSSTIHDPVGASGGLQAGTLQLAQTYGATPGSVGTFMVQYGGLSNGTEEFAQVIRIDDALGTPVFTDQLINLGDIENTALARPDASQMGSAALIDGGDQRVYDAVWRDGALYFTTTIVGSGADAGQNTVYWAEVNTSNLAALSLTQAGTIGGEQLGAGTHTYYGSIAVNNEGDVGIGYAASGPSIFAGSYFSWRDDADAAGTTRAPLTVMAGVDTYAEDFGSGRIRWGDYTATVVDPTNDKSFWTFNEFAADNGATDGIWQTVWGRFDQEAAASPVTLFNAADALVATFNTIQDAINAAGTGFKITVDAGTYVAGEVSVTATVNSLRFDLPATVAPIITLVEGSAAVDATLLGAGNAGLSGNSAANMLLGNTGNNRLDGKTGADTMTGLAGDDRYFVDNALDQVFEAGGQGTDRVLTSVNYALAGGQEIELFTTTNSSGTANINLTGNAFGQTIQGNLGNNRIDGGGGIDIMQGFAGDDRYFVDAGADQIIEVVGQGNDTVLASVSYILAAGQSIETMTTTNTAGTGAINLTGNAFDQTIRGNNGSNALNGLGGNDVFDGLFGDDRYYVDSNSDVVIEAVGRGNDRILASASYSMTTGVSVETLSTQNAVGTLGIKLYGNEFAQIVQGNYGNNTLNGRGGADILTGLLGQDIFEFTTAFGAGNIDQITDFNVVDDTINIAKSILSGFTHTGTLFAQEFFASTLGVASSATHRFIYDTDDGKLFYDADGVGGAAGVEFATLSTGLAMTNADFFVI